MTDSDLALAYAKVYELDAAFSTHATRAEGDEADRAVTAARLTAPLKRALEQWISARARRAVLQKAG